MNRLQEVETFCSCNLLFSESGNEKNQKKIQQVRKEADARGR